MAWVIPLWLALITLLLGHGYLGDCSGLQVPAGRHSIARGVSPWVAKEKMLSPNGAAFRYSPRTAPRWGYGSLSELLQRLTLLAIEYHRVAAQSPPPRPSPVKGEGESTDELDLRPNVGPEPLPPVTTWRAYASLAMLGSSAVLTIWLVSIWLRRPRP